MATLMLVNPMAKRKKRRSAAQRAATKRMLKARWGATRNPSPKRRRPRRRSPIAAFAGIPVRRRARRGGGGGRFNLQRFATDTMMPSAIGAGGALTLDILMGVLPIPAALKTGALRPIVRIAGAVGIGLLAGMITNKRMAEQIGAGALTVVLYDTLKGFVLAAIPGLPVGENDVEYVSAAPGEDYPALSYYNPAGVVPDGVGEYEDEMSAYVPYQY